MDHYVFCLEEVFLGFADFSAAVCTSFTSFSRLLSANWCISGSANICIPHTQSSLPASLKFQERSVLMGWSEWAQSVKRVCETEWHGIFWWGDQCLFAISCIIRETADCIIQYLDKKGLDFFSNILRSTPIRQPHIYFQELKRSLNNDDDDDGEVGEYWFDNDDDDVVIMNWLLRK